MLAGRTGSYLTTKLQGQISDGTLKGEGIAGAILLVQLEAGRSAVDGGFFLDGCHGPVGEVCLRDVGGCLEHHSSVSQGWAVKGQEEAGMEQHSGHPQFY